MKEVFPVTWHIVLASYLPTNPFAMLFLCGQFDAAGEVHISDHVNSTFPACLVLDCGVEHLKRANEFFLLGHGWSMCGQQSPTCGSFCIGLCPVLRWYGQYLPPIHPCGCPMSTVPGVSSLNGFPMSLLV